MTNTHKPHCSIGVLGAQASGGSQRGVVDSVGPGLNINGDDFAVVGRLRLCANCALVDFIATPSRLCGRVPRLLCRHNMAPVYIPGEDESTVRFNLLPLYMTFCTVQEDFSGRTRFTRSRTLRFRRGDITFLPRVGKIQIGWLL